MSVRRLLPVVLAALLTGCGEPPKVESPALRLSAAALAFDAVVGAAAPAEQVVVVENGGVGSLTAPVASVRFDAPGSGWLTASVRGATAPYELSVQPTVGSLAAGTYTATVSVATHSAANSPQAVKVTLVVEAGVLVTRQLTAWAEGGGTSSAPATDVVGIELLQDDGAGGTRRTPLLPGASPGTWTARPPAGSSWTQVTWADGHLTYLLGSPSLLDLGEDRGGRAGPAAAAAGTDVTLELSQLDAWQPGDELRLVSWGAGAAAALLPAFNPGDQEVSQVLDWAATMGTLLASPDVLHVGQYRFNAAETNPSFSYLEAFCATSKTGVTLVSGTPLTITAPAAVVPSVASLSVDWRRDELEAAAGPFTPGTAGFAHRLGLYAIPAPLTAPSPLGGVAVTVLESVDFAGAGDIQVTAATVGRFPALLEGWNEYVETSFDTPAPVLAPGATRPLLGALNRVRHLEALSGAAIRGAPLVGAVLAPQVDGLDALVPQAGRTTRPVLSWTAPTLPATGGPTSYRVALYDLSAAGGLTQGQLLADFVLQGTSLALPPGLLQANKAYAARITARVSPGDAGGASPFRVGVPFGEGVLWTAAFSTAP